MDSIEMLRVEKLIFGGKGLGIGPGGKKVIISGGVIPGSIIDVRVLKSRKSHFEAQYIRTREPSPLEKKLPDHWQVYGGCKWLPIPYEHQLRIKEEQVRECFHMCQSQKDAQKLIQPILPSPKTEGYRNKLEFTWGKYISKAQGIHDEYRFGFHEPASYDRIENCTYCVLASESANTLFQKIDIWARNSEIPTYDPKTHLGILRHCVIRESHATGDILLVFSLQTEAPEWPKYQQQVRDFLASLPLASVYLLHNTGKADIVDGDFELIAGRPSLEEHILQFRFDIQPKSFFQTNTRGAEVLYTAVRSVITTQGGTLLDLYAGTGTIGMILASAFHRVISVEIVASASQDAQKNAQKNGITNLECVCAPVERWAHEYVKQGGVSDCIILDPPRAGMHESAFDAISLLTPKEIIYVSCNPSTLVRDVDILMRQGRYAITSIQPVDMFPHTHHIETIVRLERN